MNLKLTKVKVCRFASHETLCFEALLTVDGIPTFRIFNDGNGGCNIVHPAPGFSGNFKETLERVDIHCKSIRPPYSFRGVVIHYDLDQWTADTISDMEELATYRRKMAKNHLMEEGGIILMLKKTVPLDAAKAKYPLARFFASPEEVMEFRKSNAVTA